MFVSDFYMRVNAKSCLMQDEPEVEVRFSYKPGFPF